VRDSVRADILAHAANELPRECCGLILEIDGRETYRPCKNLARKQSEFILDPADYMAAEDEGRILAVVHSHPGTSPEPSQADRVACEASGLPWHIVSYPLGTWAYLQPSGYRAPLLGRQFVHGVLDCYSLVRDWYRDQARIELPDFDRDEEWWKNGGDLYMQNFRKAGFEPSAEPLARGDVILMQIGADVPNHAAVYLGQDVIIHHLQRRLSCRDVYGGYWRKHTRLVLRFKGSP
jgi:proteasome lid subunit RPN8/RPN11